MNQLPFKAIATDLDGTLLSVDHVITDFAIKTLEKLDKLGVCIIIATGRNYIDVKAIFDKINIQHGFIVSSNGAEIHTKSGELLYSNHINPEIAVKLSTLPIKAPSVEIHMYQDDRWLINKPRISDVNYHQDSGLNWEVTDFSKNNGKNVTKVFYIDDNREFLDEIRQKIQQDFADILSITYSAQHCLDIMNNNVNKGLAITKALSFANLTPDDCISFGDGLNDEQMLSVCKQGCVMANADDGLKQAMRAKENIKFIGSNLGSAVPSYLRAIFAIY